MPAPVLDGSATGVSQSTTTVAAALTTTGTNRIICALIYFELNAGRLWATGVSGGGLTWNKRTQATTFQGSGQATYNGQTLELWWALAPTALAAVTMTATCSATFDGAAMLLFGVSGCNTTNPWDANVSLAARATNFFATVPTFTNISTTQANDFLIFGFGSNGNQTIGTVPTGFTSIGARVNGSPPVNFAAVGAASLGVTVAQTSQTYAWGSAFTTAANAVIFDALTADTGGSTTAPRPAWEVLTRKTIATTNTVALDTAGISANDVIVVVAYSEQTGGGPAISTISGGGLTFAQRSRSHGSARGNLEIWSALVAGTLAASSITVTYAATVDSASVLVMAMVGCDASRWDANAGLPKLLSNTAGGTWTPSVTAVTTSQAHDMVLAAAAATVAGALTVPSGFVLLDQVQGVAGIQPSNLGIGMQPRATTQSGATITWGVAMGDGATTSAGGEYIVDALTADVPPVVSSQAVRAMVLA